MLMDCPSAALSFILIIAAPLASPWKNDCRCESHPSKRSRANPASRRQLGRQRWVIHIHPATAYGDPREPGHGERIVRYMSRYVSARDDAQPPADLDGERKKEGKKAVTSHTHSKVDTRDPSILIRGS
jgi:hypothetical protein